MIELPDPPESLVDPRFHVYGNPHRLWSWMRKNTPVYQHAPSELPGFWSVTCYKDIRHVYSNPDIYSSAFGVLLRPAKLGEDPGNGITLALTDPPYHKKLRSLMAKWFTMKHALSLEDIIRKKVKKLLENATNKEICNFTHDVTSPLALYVTCYLLGIPEADQENVFNWTHEAFSSGISLATHQSFMLYFGKLMHDRMKNPTDDLASCIAHETVDDELLSENEILLNYENLLGATENAGLSMASSVLVLLQRPSIWKALCKHHALLDTGIEELFRWSSSATHSMRTVVKTTKLAGYTLEVGDRVVVWLASGNRDESVFENPNHLNLTRSSNRHLSLGHGEHFCIGNALARVQMKILLTELMDMKYSFVLENEPTPIQSIYVNGPENLPVRFTYKGPNPKKEATLNEEITGISVYI